MTPAPRLVLAPLAGFTNAPLRLLCRRRGATRTYTEMVSAAGLAHGSSPTRQLMEILPEEEDVGCQIFGAHPEELAYAAREASLLRHPADPARPRFVELNLNAGCPMPKIVHEGAGAALLKDPEKVHACLAAIRAATALPVTLKTRPGPRPDQVLLFELLDAAERAGAAGFALHARFTSQMHGGPADLALLAECVRRAKIPVTGNGGVYNLETFRAMAATGVDAVMIGRAALANPWIFGDLADGLADAEARAPERLVPRQDAAFREHLALLLVFREQLARRFPDDHVPGPDGFVTLALHTQLFRYFNGRPGSAELRRRLNAIRTLDEVNALFAAFTAPCGAGADVLQ